MTLVTIIKSHDDLDFAPAGTFYIINSSSSLIMTRETGVAGQKYLLHNLRVAAAASYDMYTGRINVLEPVISSHRTESRFKYLTHSLILMGRTLILNRPWPPTIWTCRSTLRSRLYLIYLSKCAVKLALMRAQSERCIDLRGRTIVCPHTVIFPSSTHVLVTDITFVALICICNTWYVLLHYFYRRYFHYAAWRKRKTCLCNVWFC